MRNKLKKQISITLSAALLATTCLFTPGNAIDAKSSGKHNTTSQTTTVSSSSTNELTASATSSSAAFSLTASSSSWGSSFSTNLYLNNLLGEQVTDWTLTLKNVSFTINNIWCANAEQSGSSYIITPYSWNTILPSSGSINFGLVGTGTLPSKFDFSVTYTKDGVQYTYDSTTVSPSASASVSPSASPSASASVSPSTSPSASASVSPSTSPSASASVKPSASPSASASIKPSASPSASASVSPSVSPSAETTISPSPSAESSLIESPLDQFDRTMPSTGDVHALVIMVEFQDVTFSNGLSADEVENIVFGDEDESSSRYPYESAKAIYSRASYGNLNLTGDVFTYTAQNNRSYYNNKNEYETLVMEAMKALDSSIDYSDYDSNNDGYLDCFSINIPTNGSSDDDFWYGCQATWYLNNSFKLDGQKVKGYIINDAQPTSNAMDYYNSELCHESGHLMGLPDYYKYYSSDWQGMNGSAGYEMMDDMCGGFSSFSKLMLGWLKTDEVQVYDTTQSSQTFTLSSACDSGNCIILPIGDLDDNYFSEYFIIEYLTNSNNYSGWVGNGGIRILHVNANTCKSPYSSNALQFMYENYSSYYDTGDAKQRVLKLVNDNGGFYKAGSTITYGTTNFAGYDTSGYQTIDTGYSISIGNLSNEYYTITVTK